MIYRSVGKRAADVVLAGVASLLLSPVLALAGLAIRLEDGGPIIFRQQRVGRAGHSFTIFKFRSMSVGSASVPSAAAAAAEITRVGRVIRRLNIDELPQLFNIVRGDMSLVGPRPALPSQEVLLERRAQGRAIDVRPGLTGLAQVRAYDGMDEATKADHDNEYAGSLTFWGDVKLIGSTVVYLFKPPPTY